MSKITAEEEKDLDRVSNNESDLDRVLNNELDSDRVFKNESRDSDDFGKETVKRGIGTPRRNPSSGIGTHRKVDLPFPLPPSQENSRPLVPNPYENTSWLAIEIEKLLNKKSHMANSKFKFEVHIRLCTFLIKRLFI